MTKQTSVALAINVLEALPAVITAGEATFQLIASTVATLKVMQAQARDPLPNEWAAIDAQLDALTTELDAPEGSLPGDEAGLLDIGIPTSEPTESTTQAPQISAPSEPESPALSTTPSAVETAPADAGTEVAAPADDGAPVTGPAAETEAVPATPEA